MPHDAPPAPPVAHGYSALAPEDREDAKRRHADRSLAPYAASRGLEFHGSRPLAGFSGALPRQWEQQQLMRGVLPGGRHGVLLHAVLQTHVREGSGASDLPGDFHGVVAKPPPGATKRALRPNRTWIPVVGSWLSDGLEDESRPFGVHGAWAPTTICATPVPQTIARLPRLHLRTRSRVPGFGGGRAAGDLQVVGARGDALDAALAIPRLAALRGAYWDVRVEWGMLTVTRNGYLVEDADLDGFCRLVCELADAIAAACAAPPAPPLSTELPPADPAADPALEGGWAKDALATAAARGLVLEDPAAWHAAFGALPTPGRAAIVTRDGGTRVLLCHDAPLFAVRAVRPVVVTATDLPPTPPGGVPADGARVHVQDGVALVWSLATLGFVGDALDHAAGLPTADAVLGA